MNESGYPMQVKLWNREEALDDAKIFFSGSYEKIFSFPFVRQDYELKMQRHFVDGMNLYKEMIEELAKECRKPEWTVEKKL